MVQSGLICRIVLWSLSACGGVAMAASSANLFPNPDFAVFDGDVPEGWTFDSWNQPMMKVRLGKLEPGRDGTDPCLEIQAGNPASVASLHGPSLRVLPDRDYLFRGYYSSTCESVTRRERWLNADGVTFAGNWLDPDGKSLGSFTIVLPDTQDRWVEFYDEVRSPAEAQGLQVAITRRWVGGRLRFDDFSLRRGRIRDFAEEFSVRPVPDEDFFPIFAWLAPSARYEEPGTNMDGDLQHSQYALANFNVGYSARFGVKYQGSVPAEDAELAALDKDPQLWCFHGGDEPGESAFRGLAEIGERVARLAPTKPFWVNLLPTYGFASLADYDRHIRNYIDTAKPTFFTYDHYCLVGRDPVVNEESRYGPNREGCYFPNLEIVRRRALDAGIEFGVILSVGTFGGVRGASDAELRWQAFTTLAYGSQALGWFCYLTEVNYGNWNNWEDMVINRDGTRTRHYAMLKYLNGEVLAWGPTLRRLRSTGVYHTDPLPPMTRPIRRSRLVRSVSGGMGLIGEFEHSNGRRYLMVVNRDFINAATLKVRFRNAPGRLVLIGRRDGAERPTPGYSPRTGELTVQLAAGDAELLYLE